MLMVSRRWSQPARVVVSICSKQKRYFTPDNRPSPHYDGHVPLTLIERAALAVGAGVGAFFNPRRADFIAVLGEATAQPFFIDHLRDTMLRDETGRQILRDRPRITSQSLDLNHLRNDLPPGSLGQTYVEWLDLEGVTPDTRLPVRYIDDPECAYVMQRYRECHDFYHALTGLPIIIEGEISLKAFEYANTGLPMAGIGALLAPLRLKPKQRHRLRTIYFPWAIRNGLSCKPLINVYWEKLLHVPVDQLRAELGVEKPPNLRQLRKKVKTKSVV